MSVKLPVAACLCAALDIDAHELQDAARGLPVRIEEIDGEVEVNGLPITISRAIGSGVPALADRLITLWRLESGRDSVQIIDCCGWTLASRLHRAASQVVQWRTTAGGELLWSTTDLSRAEMAAPMPTAPLVSACTWTTPIHGRVESRLFVQVTGRCNRDASPALDLMVGRLAGDGWHWQRSSPLVAHAERGAVQVQLMASPSPYRPGKPMDERSSVVLIESRPLGGVHR